MVWSEIITFVLVASLLVMSPGPNGVLIAKTVPTSGRNAGFANVAGFVTAFYLHGAVSILGISIILVNSTTAFTVVKLLGAAYLFWIGIKALLSAFQGVDTEPVITPPRKQRTLMKAYIEGVLTNALNPKVSMFYLAAFPQFIPVGGNTVASSFLLVFLHSLINAVWFGSMVLLFSKLSVMASSGSFKRWIKGITGIVFVGFSLKLAAFKPNL